MVKHFKGFGLASAAALMMAAGSHAASAAASPAAVKAAVDQAVQAFVAANPQSVGISIGVYEDGQIYTYNYGTTAPAGHIKPTGDTLYPIASITKTFTGALLAQAQVEGRLRLDDDVRKYLDGDYPNLAFEGHPIHLYDLVDHRSGLPFFMPDRAETRPDFKGAGTFSGRVTEIEKTYTRQDFFDDLHKVKLTSPPGQTFQYSNAAAMLAGYILEKVYGQSYETLVKTRIAGPLGMTHTTITLTPQEAKQTVHGYDSGRLMPDPPDAFQAAGALKSSARDMLKYVVWQIAETDPAVRLSHQSYTGPGNYQAGLNWQMLTAGDKRVLWQSGNFEGFNSFCVAEPELKLGVVVLFNEADDTSNPAHNVMVNAILKGLAPDAVALP